MYHFSGQSDVRHGVEDDGVRDVIADPHDLAVQAGLHSVNILALPQPYGHKRSANIAQHGPRQTACKLLDDIGLRLADPPPQHLDVLVDLLSGDLQLFLTVACHLDTQVLYCLHAPDASDLLSFLLCQYLWLLLVEAEVPSLLQCHQLVDDH